MRLQVIDRRLGQCAVALHAATDAQRPQIWGTVDELLDERLTITAGQAEGGGDPDDDLPGLPDRPARPLGAGEFLRRGRGVGAGVPDLRLHRLPRQRLRRHGHGPEVEALPERPRHPLLTPPPLGAEP